MLNIIELKTSDLKDYENNPRNNEDAIDKVAESIKQFGFKNPIIVDKNNVIVCGHTRKKAAEKLGITEVPCIVASDLTDDQINAFRIIDNKTAEFATWDFVKLEEELKNIDMDLSFYGFDDLLPEEENEVVDDDFCEDELASSTPYTKKQDIYFLGDHRLMCGDSTSEDDVNKLCGDTLADMVFTDPPYNVDYEGGVNEDGESMKIQNDKQSDEDFKEFLKKAFDNMSYHTKEGGAAYVCHADSEGINFRTAFVNAGFKMAECLIWVKNSFVFGRQDYHWRHEPILYGWKEGAGHYFVNDRSQDTVWEIDKPRVNDLHPTMKPLELVGRAIKNSSKKGEVVLDLFGGSGSTLIASEQAQRKSMLMELDEKYADVIVKRYIRLKGSLDNCFLLRNGVKTPLSEIADLQIKSEVNN